MEAKLPPIKVLSNSGPRKYDEAARNIIRDALKDYLAKEQIGVPKLIIRMARATDRNIDEIPPSTLQRFLRQLPDSADKKQPKTNEMSIAIYDDFLRSLRKLDPKIALFGQSLSKFFNLSDDEPLSEIPEGITGTYGSTTQKATDIFRLNQSNQKVPYSYLKVTPLESARFAIAREYIFNWNRADMPEGAHTAAQHSYYGIMVMCRDSIFMCLKNSLTGTPRTYWLLPVLDEHLGGHGYEAAWAIKSFDDAAGAVSRPLAVMFSATKDQA